MPENLTREQLIRNLPEGAKLSFDEKVYSSLDSVIRMMDEVVASDLTGKNDGSTSAKLFSRRADMREDRSENLYSRDEMLKCSEFRYGDYTVVPKIIEQEN